MLGLYSDNSFFLGNRETILCGFIYCHTKPRLMSAFLKSIQTDAENCQLRRADCRSDLSKDDMKYYKEAL